MNTNNVKYDALDREMFECVRIMEQFDADMLAIEHSLALKKFQLEESVLKEDELGQLITEAQEEASGEKQGAIQKLFEAIKRFWNALIAKITGKDSEYIDEGEFDTSKKYVVGCTEDDFKYYTNTVEKSEDRLAKAKSLMQSGKPAEAQKELEAIADAIKQERVQKVHETLSSFKAGAKGLTGFTAGVAAGVSGLLIIAAFKAFKKTANMITDVATIGAKGVGATTGTTVQVSANTVNGIQKFFRDGIAHFKKKKINDLADISLAADKAGENVIHDNTMQNAKEQIANSDFGHERAFVGSFTTVADFLRKYYDRTPEQSVDYSSLKSLAHQVDTSKNPKYPKFKNAAAFKSFMPSARDVKNYPKDFKKAAPGTLPTLYSKFLDNNTYRYKKKTLVFCDIYGLFSNEVINSKAFNEYIKIQQDALNIFKDISKNPGCSIDMFEKPYEVIEYIDDHPGIAPGAR